jgi:hypothetical protein
MDMAELASLLPMPVAKADCEWECLAEKVSETLTPHLAKIEINLHRCWFYEVYFFSLLPG